METPISRKADAESSILVTHSLIPPLPPSSWFHTRVWMSSLSPQPQRICQAWLRRAESPCASLRHWLGSLCLQKRGFPYSFLVCSDFFHCDSVLVSCMFLGINSFLLGYPICWYIIVHSKWKYKRKAPYNSLGLCGIHYNISSFINASIYLSLLSFFLV